jgi:hypothetical protein
MTMSSSGQRTLYPLDDDQDGRAELVVTMPSPGGAQNHLWRWNGSTYELAELNHTASGNTWWHRFFAGDINQDGIIDLVDQWGCPARC